MEQPTLWDWVHRCNAKGLGQRAGPKGRAEALERLSDRRLAGPTSR
ncbi:MAG: hypothetical protein ACK446_11945 [Rhodobacterales bacterium]